MRELDCLKYELQEIKHRLELEQEKTARIQKKWNLLNTNYKKSLSVPSVLSALETTLLGDTADLKKIQIVLRKLGQLMEADRCILFLIANTRQKVAKSWQWYRSPEFSIRMEEMNLVFSEHPQTMGTLRGQKPVIMERIRDSIPAYPVLGERLRKQGLKSVFIQGFYEREQLIGFIDLDYLTKEHRFSDSDLVLLKGVSNLFHLFFARLSRQRMLEKAASAMPNMLFVKDADNDFLYRFGNARFAEYCGLTSAQIPGKTDMELFPFDRKLVERYRKEDSEIIRKNRRTVLQESCTRPDGQISYQHTVKYPVRMEDGSRLLVGITSDVTDLRLSEIREKCSARILDALSQDQTLEGVLASLFSTVIDNIPWCARLSFVSVRENNSLEPAYEQAAGPEYQISQEDHILLKRVLTWNLFSLKPKSSYFCRDLQELIPDLHSRTLRSCSAAPIYTGKQLHGYILFFSKTVSRKDHSMESFLMLIREMIGITLQRLKQAQQVKNAEQLSRQLLKSISLPIFVYDAAGRITHLNAAAESLGVRISKASFFCKKIFRCSHPEQECAFRKVLESKKGCSTEASCKDRKYRLVYSPVLSEDGTVRSIVCCAEDITNISRKLDDVQQINGFLDFLLKEEDMWSAVRNVIGKWGSYLHADWCSMISYQKKNGLQSEFQYTAPDCSEASKKQFNAVCDPEIIGPEAFRKTDFLAFPSGIRKTAENSGSFYVHSIRRNGKIWGCLILGFRRKHILTSEEKQFCDAGARCVELMLIRNDYHQSLKSAVSKVQGAEHAKNLFLTELNREIRTPLNVVLGFTEILKNNALTEKQRKEYLSAVSNAGEALCSLTGSMLNFGEQMQSIPVETAMRGLLEECRTFFTEECRRKSIGLNIRIDRAFPVLVLDLAGIRQILFGLIGSIVKNSTHGTIIIECTFSPKNDSSGTLHFTVSGTGSSKAGKAEEAVSGSRLFLCRNLIEKWNGKFLSKNHAGKGLSFEISLPGIRWKISSSAIRPGTIGKTEFKFTKNVLIVDDIPLNLEVLSILLRQAGIPSLKAQNAKQALELLKTNDIGCVLTDLWMPGLTGADLAGMIRANPEYGDISIAALTADIKPSETFDMSLFDAVFFKPAALPEILDFLQKTHKEFVS